jgi:hypothetical protein
MTGACESGNKMRGISWLAEDQLAPQEGLCSIELSKAVIKQFEDNLLFYIIVITVIIIFTVTHTATLCLVFPIGDNKWD